MCTLTLVTRNDGYLLAMNRDERIARGAGTAPETCDGDGTRVVYPTDGAGGTWIGTNDRGITLALLNWHRSGQLPVDPTRVQSRGKLIPAVADSHTLADVTGALDVLDLEWMQPFRLVGIFPSERAVREWKWSSPTLETVLHSWEWQHWYSSSLSDEDALRSRGATCREVWNEADAGSSAWLRRLHGSHAGGALSVCVHRGEVGTLSYTEISCSPGQVDMEHFFGNPCSIEKTVSASLERVADKPTPSPLIATMPSATVESR